MVNHLIPVESSKQAKTLVIHGLGGVGKTQLALKYALDNSEEYSAFLWVSGKSEQSLRNGIAAFAQKIPLPEVLNSDGHVPRAEAEKDDAFKAVLGWLSQPKNYRWLMILDNADNQIGEYDVQRFLPHHGTVIITTRVTDLRSLGISLELEGVTKDEGLELLLSTSEGDKTEGMFLR